mmetsp:Transcript_64270/g.114151  ORF Transcript_64270/g.114151 Transcript_64270/m.114151 type:complete len:498 (-) Transcript_64270:136-1629(-)
MDLWEVTGGGCFLSAGGQRLAGGVHVEILDSDLRLWPEGSGAVRETIALLQFPQETRTASRCCGKWCGRGHQQTGGGGDAGPVSVRYADLLGAIADEKSSCVRLVHCPHREAGNHQSGRAWKDVVLQILADSDGNPGLWSSIEAWASKVNERSLRWGGPCRFLVFVNPAAGKNRALQIWAEVRQLWASLPWLTFDEVITSYAGEASERSQDESTLAYDAIVIVSGDGLVHEVLNGLALRQDAEQALRVPVSHIPAGSGNGLAKSVLAACDERYGHMEAAFAIAKGHKCRLHLMEVQQQGRPPRTSFLSLEGAIVSDIDIESEKLRCIGPARFTVWALYRASRPRPLRAQLIYWPASAAGSPADVAPDISSPLPEEEPWVRDEDDFLFFWGMNVPWAAYDACPSPGVLMHEPIWNLVVMRCSAPRHALVRCLLSLDSGAHVNQQHVEVIQCRAFRLLPSAGPRGGILALDGERVPFGPIQVWPALHSTQVLGATQIQI